jgi:hypothetical protein
VKSESVGLGERDVVQGWLRDGLSAREQIMIHRSWGTVAAVQDRGRPTTVLLTDGPRTWYAVAPGAEAALTPSQVEAILLQALDSVGPPAWPQWRPL